MVTNGNGEYGSFVCIMCRHPSSSLYKKYGDNVIRLTQCSKCGEIVDKYIEYDIVLVVIDLILQYIGAYRHLLINTKFNSYHKLATIFLLCDAYDKWIFRRTSSGSSNIYDLEWKFYECLLQSALEMLSFIVVILFFTPLNMLKQKFGFIIRSTSAGFYGNVFVVLSIIWHLHTELPYRALTEIFIFVSHVQVQRTISPNNHIFSNTAIIMAATAISRFFGHAIEVYFFN